jgi:HEAT repeat protein
LAGDSSVADGLVALLKKQDQPDQRALAASALGESGAVIYIPDLVDALTRPIHE